MNINIYAENQGHKFLKLIPNSINYKIIAGVRENITEPYFYLNDTEFSYHDKRQIFKLDFADYEYTKRAIQANYRNEILLRAIGKNKEKQIVDLTGGLAKESFLLCYKGFKISLIEKSPIIFLNLLHAKFQSHETLLENLELIYEDSKTYLTKQNKLEICYADPMFQEKTLSGKVKSNIEFLRKNAAYDNPLEMLKLAKAKSQKLILKLPKKSSPPTELGKYNHKLNSKNISYYVYVNN